MPLPRDAATWVARMHLQDLSADERLSLRLWLRAAPKCRTRQLMRMETIWRMVGGLAGEADFRAETERLRQRPPLRAETLPSSPWL